MQKLNLLLPLAGVVLLCGCGRQAKINSQKIDLLSQKIIQLQQIQSNQAIVLQAQLKSLAPALNQIDSSYFEKNRNDALFFHTNTLFLLLTVGQRIESQLKVADAEREAQNALMYGHYTNQLKALELCTAQIEDTMDRRDSLLESNLSVEMTLANEETRHALTGEMSQQIKSLMPTASEIARRRQLEADVAQFQRDLDLIKARLGITNQPVVQP